MTSLRVSRLIFSQEPTDTALPAKYRVYRGAADNLPDADSVRATAAIEERAVALGDADVLLVLVSGGGSALLADPIDGLTLQDKLEAIRSVRDRVFTGFYRISPGLHISLGLLKV